MSELPAPGDQSRLRVADADRDQAAALLRDAAAEGRLSMAELDERISLVYAARTYADLAAVTGDLPGAGVSGAAARQPARAAGEKMAKVSVAIMSGAKRAGPWAVPPTYTAIAVMGGVELDLRDAVFSGPETTIQAFCFMGGVSITVPEGAAVDVSGAGFMGGLDHQASGPGRPGAPRIKVSGFALMGGVEVKRPPGNGPGTG